ncbi:MAG: SUMF1/EgtB/PvdO family nonheme iron enzyme, partial [Labilithrix sp.]|nr:SUMF1/EgtB/PvdO family nonheme iron enzyme [Labilithrix sp.]
PASEAAGTEGTSPASEPPAAADDGCDAGGDCASGVCEDRVCAAPSPTDGVKNSDETDVDCGGASAPKCATGKTCKIHNDCETDACPSGVCAASRSCRQHFGGDTCGSGEIDDPARKHEDCCVSIQPGARPYRLDKYLITAGRMRAFIEATGGDVRSWVKANRPLLPAEWSEAWDDSVPANEVDVVQLIGTGQGANAYWNAQGRANGCYAKGMGGPTYWHAADKLLAYSGDERGWTKDELDTKTLNCTPRALFVAFCAWDGGRLPTYEEWAYAVRGEQTEAARPFPWGTDTNLYARASYDFNYAWPPPRAGVPLANDGLPIDRAYQVAAPGRFPTGNGPFGHADLLGLVETFVAGNPAGANLDRGGVRQYAFQEAYLGVEKYGNPKTWGHYISHYAVGARCARPL